MFTVLIASVCIQISEMQKLHCPKYLLYCAWMMYNSYSSILARSQLPFSRHQRTYVIYSDKMMLWIFCWILSKRSVSRVDCVVKNNMKWNKSITTMILFWSITCLILAIKSVWIFNPPNIHSQFKIYTQRKESIVWSGA